MAEVIAGVPDIDAARQAIEAAGWRSTVAGNRININDTVFARYIVPDGQGSPVEAKWVVYGIGDRPAVRIAATGNQATSPEPTD